MKTRLYNIKNILFLISIFTVTSQVWATRLNTLAEQGSAIRLVNTSGRTVPYRLHAVPDAENAFYIEMLNHPGEYVSALKGSNITYSSLSSKTVFTFKKVSGYCGRYTIHTPEGTSLAIQQQKVVHVPDGQAFDVQMAPITIEDAVQKNRLIHLETDGYRIGLFKLHATDTAHVYRIEHAVDTGHYLYTRENGDVLYTNSLENAELFTFTPHTNTSYDIQTRGGLKLVIADRVFVSDNITTPIFLTQADPDEYNNNPHYPYASLKTPYASFRFPNRGGLVFKLQVPQLDTGKFAFEMTGQPGHFLSANSDGTTQIRYKENRPESWEIFDVRYNLTRSAYEVTTAHGTYLAPRSHQTQIKHIQAEGQRHPPCFFIQLSSDRAYASLEHVVAQGHAVYLNSPSLNSSPYKIRRAEGNGFHLESMEHPGQYLSATPAGELVLEREPRDFETFSFTQHSDRRYSIGTVHGTQLISGDGLLKHTKGGYSLFALALLDPQEEIRSPIHGYIQNGLVCINKKEWRIRKMENGEYSFEDPQFRKHYLSANENGTLTIREKKGGPESYEKFFLQWNVTTDSYGLRTAHGTWVQQNDFHGKTRRVPHVLFYTY